MKNEKAYYVGTHYHSFKKGEPAEIIGVVIGTPPDGGNPRPCFRLRFKDGKEDFHPIEDKENYEIISETDIKEGRVPKAKQ